MKGKTTGYIIIFLSLFLLTTGYGATLSWKLPSTRADGRPIGPKESKKIIMKVYAGPTRNGPWQWIATSLPGRTSISVMDPPPGKTLWYTVKSTLNGMESTYATPVKRTNFSGLVKKIFQSMKKARIPHARKLAILSFLVLVIASVWWVRRRKTKEKSR